VKESPASGNAKGKHRRENKEMKEEKSAHTLATLPPDDERRNLVIARPNEDKSLRHIGLVGDTYTILVTGKETDGKYCLIDMHGPSGGGPPPHRHDFEEMFTVLEGEIEFTFRGEKLVARAGETINVPANAPHQFHNRSQSAARMLCMCTPAGQEEFFMEVGTSVATRTTPPPELSGDEKVALKAKVEALSLKYKSEMLEHA
jgi:quercetin dioxygenase-like cupin family protein